MCNFQLREARCFSVARQRGLKRAEVDFGQPCFDAVEWACLHERIAIVAAGARGKADREQDPDAGSDLVAHRW